MDEPKHQSPSKAAFAPDRGNLSALLSQNRARCWQNLNSSSSSCRPAACSRRLGRGSAARRYRWSGNRRGSPRRSRRRVRQSQTPRAPPRQERRWPESSAVDLRRPGRLAVGLAERSADRAAEHAAQRCAGRNRRGAGGAGVATTGAETGGPPLIPSPEQLARHGPTIASIGMNPRLIDQLQTKTTRGLTRMAAAELPASPRAGFRRV